MKEEKFGAFPTHPGEILKDEIECRGISQRKLAAEIGMSHTALNEILNAKRSVTPISAFLFEASLDIPASTLLKLQLRYDMQNVKSDHSFMERLASIRKIAAAL